MMMMIRPTVRITIGIPFCNTVYLDHYFEASALIVDL